MHDEKMVCSVGSRNRSVPPSWDVLLEATEQNLPTHFLYEPLGVQTLVTPMRKSRPEASAREKKLLALFTTSWRSLFMEPDSSMTQMMSAMGSRVMVPTSHSLLTVSALMARGVPLDRSSSRKPVCSFGFW